MFCKDTLVGVDNAGNRYYKRGSRRFVRYATSECDPTKIAFEWHLWLHHAVDFVPDGSSSTEASRFCGLGETSARDEVGALPYVPWRP
ncbi:NADH-ubiquinone oxidoreductase subunit NDUFA12 family protein [Neorickettsia risticii]|uniref:Uncharacterized protein n=1 Tax=Neorickettsia risticii (strain Illinois) TaxID=434131 RepID=C6V520_NEORI|nr:NADH-ubiquinone oxidoreductase subunit NDUFA12 family protein [Neorickettsia risticii]ACT69485.1 conserved hypothetical protein [Neorickettsia risticii str. Illinois]